MFGIPFPVNWLPPRTLRGWWRSYSRYLSAEGVSAAALWMVSLPWKAVRPELCWLQENSGVAHLLTFIFIIFFGLLTNRS